jgi:hypothetical protein
MKRTKEEIIEASKTTNSATAAASKLNIKYGTYKKYAKLFDVWDTNQSGKGISKPIVDGDSRKILLSEILEGKHPSYQSNKLRIRLFKENIKKEKCESCGLTEWLGKKISLEVDHMDGNPYNHILDNLKILCPNCHAQTETYRGKNVKNKRV